MGSDAMGTAQGSKWGVLGVLCLVACSERSAAPVASSRQGVETEHLGFYYELAFAPAPSLAALRAALPDAGVDQVGAAFARELALQAGPYWASGSITARELDPITGQ